MFKFLKNNKRLFLVCLSMVFWQKSLFSQNSTGLLFDDEAYKKVEEKAVLMRGDYQALPKSYSLKNFCPTPLSQGSYGTCVGWSTAYAARTIVEAIAQNWTSRQQINENTFSPDFAYTIAKQPNDPTCSFGTYIDQALEQMKSQGIAKKTDFDQACPQRIPTAIFQKARAFRIKDYAKVFGDYDTQNTKVEKTKKALSENKPVLIGMLCPPSFFDAKNVWLPKEMALNSYGGHAMCVVGYDDQKFGGSFEIMNSWGETWGNGGFIWIKYADFDKFVKYAFEMIYFAPKPKPTEPDLSGKMAIVMENGKEVALQHLGEGYYKSVEPLYSGNRCRIVVSNNEPAFVYVFGSDLSQKAYRLFPHKQGISPALTYKSNSVALPSENHFIKLDQNTGKDFLCVVYSKSPINLDDILKKIEVEQGDFKTKLKKVLGSQQVRQATYQQDQMKFSAVSQQQNAVVLTVEIDHL